MVESGTADRTGNATAHIASCANDTGNPGAPGEWGQVAVICSACLHAGESEAICVAQTAERAESTAIRALCPRHLWLVVGRGVDPEAIVPAIDALIADLAQRSTGRSSPHLSGPCPICESVQAAELTALSADLDATRLCRPHLALGLQRGLFAEPGEILGAFSAAGRALEQELSEMIRKADYRFRDEPRGGERDSWLRAIARVAGAPGVLWRPGNGTQVEREGSVDRATRQ